MRLTWTKEALDDLARLYDFLERVNKPAANRMVHVLSRAPDTLLVHPRVGERLFRFEPREVRRLVVGRYEIHYEINRGDIYVLRLWHGRENR